jgi:hypothetical protein
MAEKRIDIEVAVNGKVEARLPLQIRDKKHPFKSGAVGLNAGGRIYFDGVEYQASVNFVEVGSKPKA